MDKEEIQKLAYRRQYLLTPEQIDCPYINSTLKIGSRYWLYAHTDLVLTQFRNEKKQLVLLGDVFDYKDPAKNNLEILEELATSEFDELLLRCGDFAGRYVLILVEDGHFIILHDATAARKVYFSEWLGKVWFGSSPHLMAKILRLNATQDPSKLEYYWSADFINLNNCDLGNTTYYDDITQLMSNHYYDVNNKKEIRYWPLEPVQNYNFQEVSNKCTSILKGHLKSIANRYDIMLPVTAGGDSRLLLSATKEFSEDVYYYINQVEHSAYENRDIITSRKLFQRLGMEFNILPLDSDVDPEFKKIYFENNPFASKFFLPHIYNYYLNFENRINLPGNIASTPWMVYLVNKKKVKISDITKYYQVNRYKFVRNYYQEWMEKNNKLCNSCNLNVMNLFYWEERINNWGNQIAGDKDIAQEDINPLNSRILNELFLSLPLKYNNEPDKKLHRSIIMNLWPDLMKIPFNPSKRTSAMMFLARMGIFTPVARALHRASSKKM